ncbi:alpha/beta hydrolase [Rubellimicrobium rubrum]|uniref:Alpha/beta hydrolase n=1 Tax=Rubellimicrobium rubrum TaxID=2585369 RepID=A0A5C4MVN1_9RHOB|nr:alpha/beta hydrolase [Rubellimicrobium rubrum]TNC50199.1 alpha/beta hydrolase [Rubellimicrobium rubrum]
MTLPPPAGMEAWLAAREARVPHLRPGCEKRVTWAGAPERTPWSVVFIHGFSASRRELSPYPERVAEELGANLYGARLTGHGQDGSAMGRATLPDWQADVAEALAIGRIIGERVLAIACSTGGTLLTLALARAEAVAGAVMISPHYGVRLRRLQAVLDAPLSSWWGPLLIRGEVGAPVIDTTGIWTPRYPVQAYAPMAQAVRAVRRADLDAIDAPALFAYADSDQVVDPGLTSAVMRRWRGPARRIVLTPGPGDDPMGHVMAGAVKSPGQTAPLVRRTVDWAHRL